ncbi:MAG: AAA family ATPase, partial [Candidatus Poribacteria bacterium]|nr:AAA family ATPase [Candidatus Poribacteria bacterium]
NFETFRSDLTAHGSVNKNVVLRLRDRLLSKGKLDIDDLYIGFPFVLSGYTGNRAYLPAARSGIMQSHRVIASSLVDRATSGGLTPLEVPTFSGIVADFMKQLILYKESESPDEGMKCLAETIESDVLVGRILMKPTPSGYPEFLYRPREMGEELRLTRVASMVSELAPVVLFLRGRIRPGDTLIIEEPEAHLHPGAQTDIALTLAGLVRAGIRVVVTTHSDWLLKEIANLIRIGELKRKDVSKTKKILSTQWLFPEEVGTWWFQKDGIVKQIPFDRTEGIEPTDYEDVAYKLYDRSVNLQDLLEEVDREGIEWD